MGIHFAHVTHTDDANRGILLGATHSVKQSQLQILMWLCRPMSLLTKYHTGHGLFNCDRKLEVISLESGKINCDVEGK